MRLNFTTTLVSKTSIIHTHVKKIIEGIRNGDKLFDKFKKMGHHVDKMKDNNGLLWTSRRQIFQECVEGLVISRKF